MAKRGPKPKPTSILKMKHGKIYKSRHRRDVDKEPEPKAVIPDCPVRLQGVAKRTWERLTPILHRTGCLTEQDAESLAIACDMFAKAMRGDLRCVDKWCKFAAMFGLSPMDRTRIEVDVKKSSLTTARDRSKDAG